MAGILDAVSRALGNFVTQTKKKTSTKSTTPVNEHKAWIEQQNPGGFDSYYATQQQKYNNAIANNDTDMLSRLDADAKRVGYTLAPSNIQAPIQQMPMQQPIMQQPMYPDFDAQMRQMQEMYQKQMQDFQAQIQKQQLQTNYTNQNQQNVNKSVQGTLGGGVGYQAQTKPQGAQIKQRIGTQGAVSRYLATDIWKNK